MQRPERLREPKRHFSSLLDVDISRTCRWVASLDQEGVAILWRAGRPPVPTLMAAVAGRPIIRTAITARDSDGVGPLWDLPLATRVAVVGSGAALVVYTDDNQAMVWRRRGGRALRLAGAAPVLAVTRDEILYVRVLGHACELVNRRRGRLTVLAKLAAASDCLWLSFEGRREFYAIAETDVYRWTLPGPCASRLPAPPGVALCAGPSEAYRDGPHLCLTGWRVNVHTGRWGVTGDRFSGSQAQRFASGVRVSGVTHPPGVLVEGDARWPAERFGVLENRVIMIRSTSSGPVALRADGSVLSTRGAMLPSPTPPPGTRTLHVDNEGVWSASQDGMVTHSSGGTQTSWSVGDPRRERVQLRVAGNEVVAWWFGRTGRIARLRPGGQVLLFEDLPEQMLVVAFSADDRVVIACEGRVQVRDPRGRVELDWRENRAWLTAPCFTSDGRAIWLGRGQRYACYPLGTTSDGRLPVPIGPPLCLPGQVAAAASSGSRVVVAVSGLSALVWIDLEDNSFWTEAVVGPVCRLAFSADGSRVYVGTTDGRLLVRDAGRGRARARDGIPRKIDDSPTTP